MVVDAVAPEGAVVAAGAFDVVVVDLFIQQFLMEAAIYGKEEVVYAAVEDQPQIAVVKIVHGVDDGMGLPAFLVGSVVTKVFFYSPVVWKRAEVHTAAGSACCAKQVAVADGQVEGAMSTHAEPGDGAVLLIALCRVVVVDIGDEFVGDKGFVADGRVNGAVEVPAVVAAVGADEEDAIFRCFPG